MEKSRLVRPSAVAFHRAGDDSAEVKSQRASPAFRSRGEQQIALLLQRCGIEYLYEQPLAVLEGGKTRIWYPDFTLPGYGIVVEYFGRTDDPAYAAGMARKERIYQENGVSSVLLVPEDLHGNWPGRILDRIEGILEDRLSAFQRRRDEMNVRMPEGARCHRLHPGQRSGYSGNLYYAGEERRMSGVYAWNRRTHAATADTEK